MRLCLSPKIHDSRHEIETYWTIDDVAEAMEWLDLAEDMETLHANYQHDLAKARGGRGRPAR